MKKDMNEDYREEFEQEDESTAGLSDRRKKWLNILREVRSTLVTCVIVLAVVILVNLFVGRLVKVDGHSMDPNLANGELLVMDKITYDFRDPRRFEIVIFPHDDKLFIKRVIGLPGETVQIKDGRFLINGKPIKDDYGMEPIEESMYGRARRPVTLGPDEYFCVGDNRNHSGDSRLEEVGNVKRDIIQGRAVFRLLPLKRLGRLDYGE